MKRLGLEWSLQLNSGPRLTQLEFALYSTLVMEMRSGLDLMSELGMGLNLGTLMGWKRGLGTS
jgi:hypothetical protein